MQLVTSVDDYFLSLFKKFSDWFMRLTGRTNFFLAKISLCVMTASVMVDVINFWFLVLAKPTSILRAVLGGLVLMACYFGLVQCDKAEENSFSNERAKFFSGIICTPIARFIFIITALMSADIIMMMVFSAKGIMVFNIIRNLYSIALVAFLYFVAIDPPTLCKGKIKEWAESFAAGFKKLAPMKVRNN